MPESQDAEYDNMSTNNYAGEDMLQWVAEYHCKEGKLKDYSKRHKRVDVLV